MSGILISILLVFSIFTLLSFPEVNAAEVISVNAKGYENTIIIEFKNESTSKIETIRMWAGGDITFKLFKVEPDWTGGKYSDDKLLIFTATNALNLDESIKFGLSTNEKVNGINWVALDKNGKEIDTRKTPIQEISQSISSFAEEESIALGDVKETGGTLYGTKKFIPDTIRVDSNVRLIGSGFGFEKNLQLYLGETMIKSVKTDNGGNFLTTIFIPETHNVGTSEFLIKDESGNFQSTNINIKESKNRFLKSTKFEITNIPVDVGYDEKLTISGNAYPQSAIILAFENNENVLEKVRVVTANANGEWIFEETINRTETIGEKFVILKNNKDRAVKNLTVKSGNIIEIFSSTERYNLGETVSITGISEPNKSTTIWVKDKNKKTLLYDIITSDGNGNLNFEFVADDTFPAGTYSVVVKQENKSDALLFGINQYPSLAVVALMDETNFALNSNAILNIVGPNSSRLSITVLDSSDNIRISDHTITSSDGAGKYVIDLDSLPAGLYRAVVGIQNIQDSVKFSVGIEGGSGEITLNIIKDAYAPGESILILGKTGSDARLTIVLLDPSENIITKTEVFSDSAGNFSTYNVGVPSSASTGDWTITAYSRLDSVSKTIHVVTPNVSSEGHLTLQMEETEFNIGDTIVIKGDGKSSSSRVHVNIIFENGDVIASLETPLTDTGTFEMPWAIPNDINVGSYTIEISDNKNSDSVEIFIQ